MSTSVTALATVILASSAVARALPPPPAGAEIQSRCAALSVGQHVVDEGKTLSFTAGPAHPEACHGRATWTWTVGTGGDLDGGCKPNGTRCEIKAVSPTDGFSNVCLSGDSGFGPWTSCQFFAVVGRGDAVLSGFVTDRDHEPVSGTTVTAEGPGGASAMSGDAGYYAMIVKPGDYRVSASGGPTARREATYSPARRAVSVPADGRADADFTLRAGLELALRFAEDSAPASGFAVVKGTITTSEYGRPLPGETVQLDVMPGESNADSIRDAPLAAICSPARIWPQGTLADPDPTPVDVTTDSHGRYQFTVAVGSSPGTWKLQATDEVTGSEGAELSTDPDASDTESIDVKPVGSLGLAGFTAELNLVARSTNTFASLQNSVPSLFASLAAASAANASLGGVAYAGIAAKDGYGLLVFPADRPPVVRAGVISPDDLENASDLVLDPQEWVGPSGQSVTVGSLVNAIQHGLLAEPPTLGQWAAGADVQAWKTVPGNVASASDGPFEGQGWAYPPAAATGSCS